MRPVSGEFGITQGFGSLATGGVMGDPNGTMVQVLVSMYGDYQHDGHAGTDAGCPVGTPVRAARSGTVVLCDWDVNLPGDDSWSATGYFQRFAFYKRFGGRLLVVKVAENDYDVYAHLSAWKTGYGQRVTEGQVIALSGDSSAGKDGQLGPHLHTERIVDLTYSTGNGRIFGRIDPTTVWGNGIAAMGGSVTPQSTSGGFLMALTDKQQDEIYYILCSKDGRQERAQQDANVLLASRVKMLDGGSPAVAELFAVFNDRLNMLKRLNDDLRAEADQVRAKNGVLMGTVDTLANLVASTQSLDAGQIKQAVSSAIADGITLTVKAGN